MIRSSSVGVKAAPRGVAGVQGAPTAFGVPANGGGGAHFSLGRYWYL